MGYCLPTRQPLSFSVVSQRTGAEGKGLGWGGGGGGLGTGRREKLVWGEHCALRFFKIRPPPPPKKKKKKKKLK